MEYAIVGSVLSLLLSMKFTRYTTDKQKAEYQALVERVEKLEAPSTEKDKALLKNVMTTIQPIAVAVQKLNNEVGIR